MAMAAFIKKTYNLMALQVSLLSETDEAQINFELQGTEQHKTYKIQDWIIPSGEFGLPPHLDRQKVLKQGYQFHLPQYVVADTRKILDSFEYNGPIWLHLVKPYGFLGLVPWESLLLPEVNRPVLRLPDAWADPPDEIPSTLDVALCASEPVADTPFDIVRGIISITEGLLHVPRPTVRVNIFTDQKWFHELRGYWDSQGLLNKNVFVHDQAAASAYATPRRSLEVASVRELASPWLLWMREALAGRSVDLVYFLSHGYMSELKGALALAESPTINRDASWSRFVGADELNMFLLQVGAWSVTLDSPLENYSEMGLRSVADDLAQRRPGPVLHHETRLDDPSLTELAGTLNFLYNPLPATPPCTRSISLCCQPFRVEGYQEQMEPKERRFTFRQPTTRATGDVAIASLSDNVPAWLAAAQRYVEQKQFRIDQTRQKTGREISPRGAARIDGVERGIDEIKEAIARMASKSGIQI
jgi:hypothetical protein